MRKLKENLKENPWPVNVALCGTIFAQPLQEFIGIPLWLTGTVCGEVTIGRIVVQARQAWRQAARDRAELAAKHAIAHAQLFGSQNN